MVVAWCVIMDACYLFLEANTVEMFSDSVTQSSSCLAYVLFEAFGACGHIDYAFCGTVERSCHFEPFFGGCGDELF